MKKIFVSNIKIEKVRHLRNIDITLSKEEAKHLIFTGKNGSGKTSVLDALSYYLDLLTISNRADKTQTRLQVYKSSLERFRHHDVGNSLIAEEKNLTRYGNNQKIIKSGISVEFNEPADIIRYCFEEGQFILAYYKADRIFEADIPEHVEKVNLKEKYSINEEPRQVFVKYLLDLKVTEVFSRSNGNIQKAESINKWFIKFQELLRRIFDDESLELIFEEDAFQFYIKEKNREIFDFNTLSSGFAAVLDIVLDIIVRMEKATNKSFDFNIPGIVLIDEIETHLHLELQRNILELLTSVFPNIQFIVSTHSPFILNSLDNVVIYDLENNIIVKDGLSNVPYEGIVEGYFKADSMSNLLKKKYNRYKELVIKQDLTDDDFEEIADLEVFLNEIPDYLALNITTEYQRLKTEFENREDI
ncbi:MAG: AAA family ATPase [Bacillota bacterium]|nr:AAA family ATPase [Bacillota bacterium]